MKIWLGGLTNSIDVIPLIEKSLPYFDGIVFTLDEKSDKSLFDKWGHYTNLNLLNNINENLCGKILHKDFVDEFDCIIVMHIQEWIDLNVDVFKNKKVI